MPNVFWHHELNPEYKEYYTLNKWGVRGKDFEIPKPPHELRVLAIGDSTTEGWKNPENETYPYFLERYLEQSQAVRDAGFTSVVVVNAGTGSHNTAFNLAYLQFRGLNFEPDIVILKSAYNDFGPFLTKGLGLDYTNTFRAPLISERTNARMWSWARRSDFLSLLCLVLLDPPYRQSLGANYDFVTSETEFDKNLSKLALATNNVRAMVQMTRMRGAVPILLDLPYSPEPAHYDVALKNPELSRRLRKFVDALNAGIAEISNKDSVPLVNTSRTLGKDDFWDHAHNSAAGNHKIAQLAGKAVEAALAEKRH